jgi:peptidoglycan/xylan/chitin deacetylase (PgdA/CDA1 family)
MRIVSNLLKKVAYPSLASLGVFRGLSMPGLAVLTYHGVFPHGYQPVDPAFDGNLVSAEMLRQQLRLLESHYTIITPEDALAWRKGNLTLPKKAVLVTCDDGLLNNLTDMLPVLQQEGVKCLFFVTGASAGDERKMLWYEDLYLLLVEAHAGRIQITCEGITVDEEIQSREQRRAVWWSLVKRLSQLGSRERGLFLDKLRAFLRIEPRRDLDSGSVSCQRFALMTSRELRELAAAGMTIGAHTMSHPMLSQAPAELAHSEIAESRRSLEAALQRRVWAFAYPFGDAQSVTPQVLAMPEAAGYHAAFLNYGGGLGTELPSFALPRIHVTADMSLAELEAHVSGFYMRLQRSTGRTA